MADDMITMLYTYPQLYVNLGVIAYIIPKKEFCQYLKRLVDAGFENRIMYGSDQMIWPSTMVRSIDNIEMPRS
jgi:predicted TIM-barrel fold metal-dependent hydrolase